MTIAVFAPRPASRNRETLRHLLVWLRQARVAATLPGHAGNQACFQDEPARIAATVDRGAVELGLLGLGWQPPRTSRRR